MSCCRLVIPPVVSYSVDLSVSTDVKRGYRSFIFVTFKHT